MFQTMPENQLNTTIKEFQSDGGGEFTSHMLKKHFADRGIVHQLSCPYTPEQNGKTEQKHIHIVEVGLSMMCHSKSPFQFWVEAFFTSNYVVNLLPSQTDKNPHEKLFKEKPDYSMLRVFGSACYPFLRPVSRHKFDPR